MTKKQAKKPKPKKSVPPDVRLKHQKDPLEEAENDDGFRLDWKWWAGEKAKEAAWLVDMVKALQTETEAAFERVNLALVERDQYKQAAHNWQERASDLANQLDHVDREATRATDLYVSWRKCCCTLTRERDWLIEMVKAIETAPYRPNEEIANLTTDLEVERGRVRDADARIRELENRLKYAPNNGDRDARQLYLEALAKIEDMARMAYENGKDL